MGSVNEKVSYTLQEVQEKLKEPQHRLIHLCEKGVVIPDFEDAQGRGTMRRFSERNLFEFALALELRRFTLPVAYLVPIIKVLRAFETYAAKQIEVFSLPKSLQNKPSVKLNLIITDGEHLFFTLKHKGETRYIGGLDLESVQRNKQPLSHAKVSLEDPTFSFTSRFEVDLNKIAQAL